MKHIYLSGANTPCIKIIEQNDVYVSGYSEFLIKNMPLTLKGKIICDYGSGTGIIGLCSVAKGAKKVIALESDERYLKLTKKNINNNCKSHLFEFYSNKYEFEKKRNCLFDYIFCNPSSLPSAVVGNNSFYSGGEFGLDMIMEVIGFSKTYLENNGHLIILITSILPTSLFQKELLRWNMKCAVLNSMDLKFREHYKHIKDWVDKNKKVYPEMLYIEIDGVLYERIVAYDVTKINNEG